MEKNVDNLRNEDFIEIMKNEESFDSNIEEKILLVTTDRWLAQLSSKKNN